MDFSPSEQKGETDFYIVLDDLCHKIALVRHTGTLVMEVVAPSPYHQPQKMKTQRPVETLLTKTAKVKNTWQALCGSGCRTTHIWPPGQALIANKRLDFGFRNSLPLPWDQRYRKQLPPVS